jgi:hypothetical protein
MFLIELQECFINSRYKSLSRQVFANISPLYDLSFHFNICSVDHKSFILMKYTLFFIKMDYALGVIFKKSLLNPRSQKFSVF